MSSLFRLVVRNALRNRRRTLLTISSVAVSLFLLVSLRTFLDELTGESMMSRQSARRLLVRHAVSLQIPLPLAYRRRIEQIPEVEMVTEYQWYPCYYRDPKNLMVVFAVDPRFVGTDPDYPTAPDQLEAFRRDRAAVLVPRKMMERFGWNIGDRVVFISTIFPWNHELTIRGVFDGPTQSSPYMHYGYFNETTRARLPRRVDRTTSFFVRTRTDAEAAPVAKQIDEIFANSDVPTRTESEKNFVVGFSSMLGNVRMLISIIAAAVVFAILLVTMNTMAMTVRERTTEIAIMKTLGYRPSQLLLLIVAEAVLIAGAGGALGILSAFLFFDTFDIYQLTNGVIQHFNVRGSTVVVAVAASLAMGVASSVAPAAHASRRPIATAIRNV